MRWPLIGAALLLIATAVPVRAQGQVDGARRFTRDTVNGTDNEREGYIPLATAYPGRRPPKGSYTAPAATWLQLPVGSANVKPNNTVDKGTYTVDRFERTGMDNGRERLRIVITRRPGPAPGGDLPEIHLTDPVSHITTMAMAEMARTSDGVRYTFDVEAPPAWGYAVAVEGRHAAQRRFQVDLVPSGGVRLNEYWTYRTKPTFGQTGRLLQQQEAPGALRARVAGRRQEYRNGKPVSDSSQK